MFPSNGFQSIGQAYDDMQTQNQHLLQQITERDDYNIKVESGCLYYTYDNYNLLFLYILLVQSPV